jgi:hypothetical protein
MDDIVQRKKRLRSQKAMIITLSVLALTLVVVVIVVVLLTKKKSTTGSLPLTRLTKDTSHAEVFLTNEGKSYNFPDVQDAAMACSKYGARIATYDQLVGAWKSGAEWCAYGYVEDGRKLYPVNHYTSECDQEPGIVQGSVLNAGATCYGVKPKVGTPGVFDFKPGQYSMYDLPQ